MSYQLTHFRRGEFQRYLSFVRRLRVEPGPTAEDLRHRWRVFDNPWDGYFMIAHTADELAATLTLSARRLRTPAGEALPCFELSHGWTSERHRRRGLFHTLGGYARELVFSGTEAGLIIGAPNPAAEPNWRKHRYLFTRDDGTALLLLPSAGEVLRRRALRGGGPVLPRRRGQTARLAGRGEIEELPFAAYAARTAALPRMNEASDVYLRWRFHDTPDGYRFFAARGRAGELLCALRVTHLGDLPTLVVSEYALDGRIDDSPAKLRWLPRIATRFYRRHAGVYLNARLQPTPLRYLDQLRHRYLVHRPQPLCFLFKDGPTAAQETLMSELRRVFQLSDCDVG